MRYTRKGNNRRSRLELNRCEASLYQNPLEMLRRNASTHDRKLTIPPYSVIMQKELVALGGFFHALLTDQISQDHQSFGVETGIGIPFRTSYQR